MNNILIIDGNVSFRQALARMIDCRLPAIDIEDVSDSNLGLEKIQSSLPFLVFVDVHLSGIDGLAYIQKIRQTTPQSVIIALTRYNFPEFQTALIQSGADYYIPKDAWTGEEILNLVESIVQVKSTGKKK
jgi:CheY-like chemotaxis protein